MNFLKGLWSLVLAALTVGIFLIGIFVVGPILSVIIIGGGILFMIGLIAYGIYDEMRK